VAISQERLKLAYKSGVFPWFEAGDPILWWSPNPRMVCFLSLIVSKSMRNILNRDQFGYIQSNRDVISHCPK
jgi:leucyl/phenylalanyl-tRNA--protein transferase